MKRRDARPAANDAGAYEAGVAAVRAESESFASGVLPDGVVWKGNPALVPFLLPVAELHEDAANVNTHPERSIASIAASYARFGQQKPIVCGQDLVTRDGNGQLRAAAERLGWTHVAAIPSDLDGVELSAYALAVNRTAQHSEWDHEALSSQLRAIQDAGAPIDDLGWASYELEPLLAAVWTPPAPTDGALDAGGSHGGGPAVEMADPIHVTAEQWAVIARAVEKVRASRGDDTASAGRCLELVCGDYLAGAGQ